mgnify:FL=1
MKHILLTIFLIFGLTQTLFAQQIALNSQYLFNTMLVNPGATGTKDYVPVQLNFRKQWTNFPGSPTTQFLSCDSKLADNFGIGGIIYNDVGGPSRRTGVNINAAYHLQIDAKKDHMLSFGLGVSLTQHIMDMSVLTTYLPDDPAVLNGYNNQMVPDANFGIFYTFKNNLYVGLSSYNLSQSKRDLYAFNNRLANPLARNYYFTSGYKFTLAQLWKLKAATLVQAIEAGAVQWDLTSIVEYKDSYWLGLSYRLNDALAVLGGAQIGPLKFGYSYDFSLSEIGEYSAGSHEVFIEFQIGNKNAENNRVPWLKRNRIYTPSNE